MLRLSATLWLILCCVGIVSAQPTAFTYQGKLTDAGNPANGPYDLQFKLFDTVTVGTGIQQGGVREHTVTVSAGVFTVTLDFGANVFSGADRYLEIGVRPANSAIAYTVLAPRQPITSSPYAIQTLNAQKLGGIPASGFVQNTDMPQAGASFNIGGSGTLGSLQVNGPVSLGGIAPPATAPIGQGRLYFDSATNKVRVSENGAAFVNLVGATGVSGSGTVNSIPLWSAGTTLGDSVITQSAGIIGIGTNTPFAGNKLDVAGQVLFRTGGSGGGYMGFGSPNAETGMTITGNGTNRADLRFDGATLKLVASSIGIPPVTNGIAITTAGNVGIGVANPASKLDVTSNGTSIAGKSTGAGVGVYGESAQFNGVRGIGHNVDHGAVVGVHDAGGIAVYGTSNATGIGVFGDSVTGTGVYGRTTAGNTAVAGISGVSTSAGGVGVKGEATYGVYGKTSSSSGIGVYGESNTGSGIGVYGTSTSTSNTAIAVYGSSPNGIGVRGESANVNGFGVRAQNASGMALGVVGNAQQSREKGGFVKAMLFVDSNGTVVRCFNSQMPDGGTSLPPSGTTGCGFSIWEYASGRFEITFPFQVDDRFVAVSAERTFAETNFGVNFRFTSANTINVYTFYANERNDTFSFPNFMIIVF